MIKRVMIALMAILALAGCSYASPDTSSVGLMYTGGDYESKVFDKCAPSGSVELEDWGGYTAFYPAPNVLVTYDFSTRPGAESGPILVSTNNNQEMVQSGTISLRLLSTCDEWTDPAGKKWPGGIAQSFHENVGQRNAASFTEDSSQIPQGWLSVLSKTVGAPGERAMDQAGGLYSWQELYSNAEKQKAFADAVVAALPERMKSTTGGVLYWEIVSIELDKPTVPEGLRQLLLEKEKAILEQDKATQQRLFQEQWPGGIAGYQAFQRQQAETKCLNEGKCSLIPSGVTVSVPA